MDKKKCGEADIFFTAGCGRCSLYNTPACKVHTWHNELQKLRQILLNCKLQEVIKWGVPCYTFEQKNIAMIAAFKENCTISFFKGALLTDPEGILLKPGENTQIVRIIRFSNVETITTMETILKAYICEAIEIEKKGLKASFKKIEEHAIPEEFQNKLTENVALKTAFEALTPGRQRAYLLHFSAAKQPKTRVARIENCIAQIMNGIGFNENN